MLEGRRKFKPGLRRLKNFFWFVSGVSLFMTLTIIAKLISLSSLTLRNFNAGIMVKVNLVFFICINCSGNFKLFLRGIIATKSYNAITYNRGVAKVCGTRGGRFFGTPLHIFLVLQIFFGFRNFSQFFSNSRIFL